MLAVACCGFDDPEGLERLIKSCWRNVDLFFYIDGPFAGYESANSEYIKKETLYVLKDYPNVLPYPGSNMLEYEKRQLYLNLCEQWMIEWLIIVDTDEYFHPDSDWNAFIEERRIKCNDRDHLYNLKNYTEIDRLLLPLDQPRLIHWPSMIHYLNGHHYQLSINGTEEAITAKDTLYSVKLCHDSHLRTQERKDKHDEYIHWLKRYEAGKMVEETPKEKENRLVSVWSGN
jgi:hypothetical protein